jgi:hypothetical protein
MVRTVWLQPRTRPPTLLVLEIPGLELFTALALPEQIQSQIVRLDPWVRARLPIFIGPARFINNTGGTIASLSVSYTGEQWRSGGCSPTPCTTAAQTVDFQYQVANAGVISDANAPTTNWLDHDPLDFTSPTPGTSSAATLDGNAAANRAALVSTITVTVNPGQEVWLRWKDINHAGNDHGLAIDDLSVTANGPADTAPTVISTTPANGATNVPVNSTVAIKL